MKLDPNIIPEDNGSGKYALLQLRRLREVHDNEPAVVWKSVERAVDVLLREGILDWGKKLTENEFFVIRLKDQYAQAALYAYADAALGDDVDYANEIVDLARRAGPASPWCKRPD